MDTVDFSVKYHGSVVLVTAESEEARTFTKDRIPLEGWQMWGRHGFVLDTRIAPSLLELLEEDGFNIGYHGIGG